MQCSKNAWRRWLKTLPSSKFREELRVGKQNWKRIEAAKEKKL